MDKAEFQQLQKKLTGKAVPERTLEVTRASDVEMEATEWLWQDRIPLGELTLLAGKEGIGKSTIGFDLAARISTGTLLGNFYGKPRSVIVAATEDDWAKTVTPRLVAAEADLRRVLKVIIRQGDNRDQVSLPDDIGAMGDLIATEKVGLILLDPLISRLSGTLNTHKDGDVRKALEPFVDLAHESSCGILGIIHVNKSTGQSALNRVMGSKAFTAVSRSVLFVMEDPDDETVSIIGRPKTNLAVGHINSQRYTLETETVGFDERLQLPITTAKVIWGDETSKSIETLLKQSESGEAGTGNRAVEWLREYLADGEEHASAIIKVEAKQAGLSESALKRASLKLRLIIDRDGYQGTTWWKLPETIDTAS